MKFRKKLPPKQNRKKPKFQRGLPIPPTRVERNRKRYFRAESKQWVKEDNDG